MISYWLQSDEIRERIYIPKYYDPVIRADLLALSQTHDLYTIGELAHRKIIVLSTGDEIGKAAYGTGDYPFVRTSDISNWEIKTLPKQGVSQTIYEEYAPKQNVQEGDILLVRDGTYLIGRNCFITTVDQEIIYQSHIVKFRIVKPNELAPELFFLSLNSPIVQRQIRSVQFTADIIDTLGQRLNEIILPIPKDPDVKRRLVEQVKHALSVRVHGKGFIKHAPYIIETALKTSSVSHISEFLALPLDQLAHVLKSRTITAEFGGFENLWLSSLAIRHNIYLPKYYDPSIANELNALSDTCDIRSMSQLRRSKIVTYHTGVEIGKAAYGSGNIAFLRTSDFTNWEILHESKQGISQRIFEQYVDKCALEENDILLVRDGTYLIGSSCLVTKRDINSLFCGGLLKIHVQASDELDPFLLLGLLNSFIVKRQIRSRQFTRDVIDTLGNRFDEVQLPIPKDRGIRQAISEAVRNVIVSRIESRDEIRHLATEVARQVP